MVNKSNKEWLVHWLDTRFAHRDYSILNKKFKKMHHEQVAGEIIRMIDIHVQKEVEEALGNK